MNQPPLDLLLSKVDNKYELVVKAAKRARSISEHEVAGKDGLMLKGKPVTLALHEIAYSLTVEEDLDEDLIDTDQEEQSNDEDLE